MPSSAVKYQSLEELNMERDAVAWYWRVIALVSSFMILGGYLILPATFDNDPKLREGFTIGVLSILIVTTLTTGYSFTALLCFACRNWRFQAESVFLPALTSSALGLLTIMWCFGTTTRYHWNTAASVTAALAASSSIIYSVLLFITHRKINNFRKQVSSRASWGDTYYKNYLANMYPSAFHSGETLAPTDDELVNHRLALLLKKHDPGLSPEASQSTFRIDLPEEPIHESMAREMPSSHAAQTSRHATYQHHRSHSSLSPPTSRGTFGRIASTLSGQRGRSGNELTINDGRGRESSRASNGSRAMSREERRREIELGPM